MQQVITILATFVVEMFIALTIFSDLVTLKKTTVKTVLTSFVAYMVLAAVYLGFDNIYLNSSSFFVINCFLLKFVFNAEWKPSLIVSAIMTITMSVTEFMAISFLASALNIDINLYLENYYIRIIAVIFSKTLYLVLNKLIVNIGTAFKKKSAINSTIYLFMYPFCSLLIFFVFWKISIENNLSYQTNIIITISSILILFSIIVTYIFYTKAVNKEVDLYKLQSELERKNIDEAYYKVLDYQNEELKTLVHDEKNHLAVIKSLSSIDEVDKYINNIYEDLEKYSSSGKTKNKMLDLILNKYKVLCEEDGIDFYINIRTSNLSFMENTDLTTMLSNILDNAIEAAKKTEEKKIDLSINRVSGNDMLTCVNSCDVKPISVSGVLKTTKEDKKFHGMGIKSVKRIVNKYDGEYEWDYSEKKRAFSTYIMFPNNKERQQ